MYELQDGKYVPEIAKFAKEKGLLDHPDWKMLKFYNQELRIPRKNNPFMNSTGYAVELVPTLQNLQVHTGSKLGEYRQWSNTPRPVNGILTKTYLKSRDIQAPKRMWSNFNYENPPKGEYLVPETFKKKVKFTNAHVQFYEKSPTR